MREKLASKSKSGGESLKLIARFNEGVVEEIRKTEREKLPEMISKNISNKSNFLKPFYGKTNDDDFIKWIYRVYYNKKQARGQEFKRFNEEVNRLRGRREQLGQGESSQYQLPPPQQESSPLQRLYTRRSTILRKPIEEFREEREQMLAERDDDDPPSAVGSGFLTTSEENNFVCPDNIINDVSRLEVLIGGKRAGNNSPEITNEAADICQRLFRGGIMDIGVYRELIDELVDD